MRKFSDPKNASRTAFFGGSQNRQKFDRQKNLLHKNKFKYNNINNIIKIIIYFGELVEANEFEIFNLLTIKSSIEKRCFLSTDKLRRKHNSKSFIKYGIVSCRTRKSSPFSFEIGSFDRRSVWDSAAFSLCR